MMKRITLLAMITTLTMSFTGEQWKSIYNRDNIIIKYTQSDCLLDNSFKQRWFLLSFTNTSSSKLKVQWNIELFDENKKCITCNQPSGEYAYSLVLAPGETRQGECSFSSAPELRIVSKLLDVDASMSYPDFKVTDVKISNVK